MSSSNPVDIPLPSDVRLQRLPLATLYLTERCNSRCVTCDYWRHGRLDMSLQAIERLLPQLLALQTRWVLISGGEPLLNPDWEAIARLLRSQDLELWLLTSGLSLAKHASRVAQHFRRVTVSLDGTTSQTYAAIRGLDAFDKVCAGIRAVVAAGIAVTLRVTLQKTNHGELLRFVELARELGVQQISFLAVDVGNPHAFGRVEGALPELALAREDLPLFAGLLERMEQRFAAEFACGFIAESPAKLRRILEYFTALQGLGPLPAVRCNAPEFSAVIDAAGHVRPCFFIPGPPGAHVGAGALEEVLNSGAMLSLRSAIRARARPECLTCVCSMYRPGLQ